MKQFERKLKQLGFTLIELGMVIVILGVLSAIAIPKYANVGDEALAKTKLAMVGNVKSALMLTHVEFGRADPSTSELAANVQGSVLNTSNPSQHGLDVNIDGTTYFIPLYEDFECTIPVITGSDLFVQCVGDIA